MNDAQNDSIKGGFLFPAAAYFLSAFFSPPLVVCYCALAILPFLGDSWPWILYLVSIFVLPPLVYVVYLMRRNFISEFHMAKRSERFRPMKLMILNTTAGILLFRYMGGPSLILDVALASLVLLFVLFTVTLHYKVSAHSAAVSSLWVLLLILYGTPALAFGIFPAFVSWARVRLLRHTTIQTVVGSFIGVFYTFLVLYIRGRI